MNSNERLKSRVIYKASETFSFPQTDESYRTTVKLIGSQLVRVVLHDFKVYFTVRQANEVATGLMKAVINSIVTIDPSTNEIGAKKSFDHWSALIESREIYGSLKRSELHQVPMSGENFLIVGTLLDPRPVVGFNNGEEPVYDFQIRLDGQCVLMLFGWVGWSLSRSEAQWLAEQLWSAVFLATKPKAEINHECAQGVVTT